MVKRVEGQIWIDRKAPYNLKYFVHNKEHAIDTAVLYNKSDLYTNSSSDSSSVSLADYHIGTLLALEGDKLVRAEFPKHINDVIGICTEEGSELEDNSSSDFAVINEGALRLEKLDSLDSLVGFDTAHKGDLVYWDIGYYSSTENASIQWNKSLPGRLSLKTPNSDFTYHNLPVVGVVTTVLTSDNSITAVEIHLNFSRFDSTIEWERGFSNNTTQEIPLKSGLLQSDTSYTKNIQVFIAKTSTDSRRPILCNFDTTKGTLDAPGTDNIYLTKTLTELFIQGTVNIKGTKE